MKRAVWLVSGLLLAWAAYSVAPDVVRYAKMRAM
jgi:hypothetical protein